MLETLMYVALGLAYSAAREAEKEEEEHAIKEEQKLQEELKEIDRKTNLDIMYFYYSWYNNIPYNRVKQIHEEGTLKIEELEKCLKEHQ